MNTPNNRRRKASQERMEKAFVQLLQERDLDQISVTSICKEAAVNRSTFYANYTDVYALAEAVQRSLEEAVLELYTPERQGRYHSYDFLRLFRHIRENQIFYKTYFKLGGNGRLHYIGLDETLASERFADGYVEYHIEFFRNGLNAVIRKWLENGCRETPEEIDAIIRAEYSANKA